MTSNVVYGDNKIFLGKQGENNATQIVFPVSSWIAEQGAGGVFTLNNQRPGESQSYPCTTTVSNNNVYWTITANETCYYGVGKCELSYILNGTTIAKTQVYDTYVTAALGQTDEVPFPNTYNAWKTDLLTQADGKIQLAAAQATAASNSADRAEAAAQSAEEIGGYVVRYDENNVTGSSAQAIVRKNAGADSSGIFPISVGGTGNTTGAVSKIALPTAETRSFMTCRINGKDAVNSIYGNIYDFGDFAYINAKFTINSNIDELEGYTPYNLFTLKNASTSAAESLPRPYYDYAELQGNFNSQNIGYAHAAKFRVAEVASGVYGVQVITISAAVRGGTYTVEGFYRKHQGV